MPLVQINVFKDVEDIRAGVDFREVLREEILACDVVLVIVGDKWATITDDNNQPRLMNAGDFVRFEVETGLKSKDILVIPVLVNEASMPHEGQLPSSLKTFPYLNAVKVRHDPDFRKDVQNLIDEIKYATGEVTQSTDPIASRPTAQGTAQYEAKQKPKSSGLLVWGGVVAILVLAIAIGAFIFGDFDTGSGSAISQITQEPLVDIVSPADVITNYWILVGDREYQDAWQLLSPNFRSERHDNDYQDYVDGHVESNYCDITVPSSTVQSESGANATVYATVNYQLSNCLTVSDQNFEFGLTYNYNANTWQLDSVRLR